MVRSLVLFLAVVAMVVIILSVAASADNGAVHDCPVGTVSVGACQ